MKKLLRLRLVLFINYFVFSAMLNSVGLLIQKSINTYGIPEAWGGFLELSKDSAIAITAFLIGSFLPKLGFKKGFVLSILLVMAGCAQMYFGNNFASVAVLFACTGVSFAIVKISVLALVGEITEGKQKHQSLMSFLESVFMLGIVFVYLVFPMFYSNTNPDGWLNIYLVLIGLLLVVLAITWATPVEVKKMENSKGVKETFVEMLSLLSKPMILLFAAFAFLYVMTEQGIMSWLPTFNQKVLNLSEQLAASMAVLLTLSIFLGRFLSGFMVERVRWLPFLLSCLVGAAVMILLALPLAGHSGGVAISKLRDAPLAAFIFPLIGFFLAPIYPLVNSIILGNTPNRLHGSMAAIITFISAIGGTMGSMAVGFFFNALGNRIFYLALIPLGILMVVFVLLHNLIKREGA